MSDRKRGNYLSVTQVVALRDWAQGVHRMFPKDSPVYQVGSTLHRLDWRDVDVRLLMADKRYDRLVATLDVGRLNYSVSLWGQQVTGLPIDFQVQRRTEANAEFPAWRKSAWRNPLIWIES